MARKLNLYGNHRGGTSIVNALPVSVAERHPEWMLADPQEERATTLAAVVQQRFPQVSPRPLCLPARDALSLSGDDDTVVLAIDTVADTRTTLAARRPRQRTTFQLVGRGPGGMAGSRVAVGGTVVPGDEDTERRALLLLDTLDQMTRAASSRVLTANDPLTAAVLRPLRNLATQQTVRHLAVAERDPWDLPLGPLTVVLGATSYPLVPVRGEPQARYSERTNQALEGASAVRLGQWVDRGYTGRFAVVAVVVPEDRAVHFLRVVESRRAPRRVDAVTTFSPPPPRPARVAPVSGGALFTD